MNLIPTPPTTTGSAEQQLEALRSYLFQQTEALNVALSGQTLEKQLERITEALSPPKKGTSASQQSELSKYQSLKALIIKTADTVVVSSEEFRKTLSGYYVTSSNFGEYLENATVDIEGTPVGIKQLYSYTAGIRSDYGDFDVERQTFIKTGMLYYDDDGLPVYGVGIGELKTKVTADGQVVLDRGGLVSTHTADRISFWENDIEVAYISNGALHMPAADITGGTLNIGLGTFKVDAFGAVTATKGNIGGCEIVNGLLTIANANIKNITADKVSGGTLKGVKVISQNGNDTVTLDKGKVIASNGSRSVDITPNGIVSASVEIMHEAYFHENVYIPLTNLILYSSGTGERHCLGFATVDGYSVPYFD